jgi:hypothetical protein
MRRRRCTHRTRSGQPKVCARLDGLRVVVEHRPLTGHSLMLALGLILLVGHATVGQPPSAAPLGPLGWLLAVIGLILALVAVLVTTGT